MDPLEEGGLGLAVFSEEDLLFDGPHPFFGAEFVGDVGEIDRVDPGAGVPTRSFGIEPGAAAGESVDDFFDFGGVVLALNTGD